MKVFGGFLLVSYASATDCGPGMATGINASGEADASNTETCFPTTDAAFIVSCNNPDTNVAEMKIAIEKNFFEANLSNLDGFSEDGAHYYRTVAFGSNNYRGSDDGEDIELFFSVMSDAEVAENQGQSIIMAAQKNLEFACKYSLASQTLTSATDTVGSDITIARESRGNLVYSIDVDAASVVGQRKNFSIVPATPGVVHTKVRSCEVLNDDETQRYELTSVRGTDTCTDWLTEFTNDSGSWCTDQKQDFSFTGFKWDATTANETQKIRCTIELTTEHDYNYEPDVCSVTTTSTTTTTTTTTPQIAPQCEPPLEHCQCIQSGEMDVGQQELIGTADFPVAYRYEYEFMVNSFKNNGQNVIQGTTVLDVYDCDESTAGHIGTLWVMGNSDGTFNYASVYNCVNRAHNGVALTVDVKKNQWYKVAFIVGNGKYQVEFDDTVVDERDVTESIAYNNVNIYSSVRAAESASADGKIRNVRLCPL